LPTCSYCWLHWDFRRYRVNTRTALLELNLLTGRSHLANFFFDIQVYFAICRDTFSRIVLGYNGLGRGTNWSVFPYIFVDVLRRTQCRHRSQQLIFCCGCLLPWKFCLSGCWLDTDLRNRYLGGDLVTCEKFPWKVPTSIYKTSFNLCLVQQIIS
jgi:hypothetical protein